MFIVLGGLILAFLLILIFANRDMRQCRWRARGLENDGKSRKFKCMTCGVEAISEDGHPPRRCMRAIPPPPL